MSCATPPITVATASTAPAIAYTHLIHSTSPRAYLTLNDAEAG